MKRPSAASCRRALWLLGLVPPFENDDVIAAWRDRVRRAHPDRHAGDTQREAAAATLTRALNDARETLEWWLDSGLDWPEPLTSAREEPPPARPQRSTPPPVCPRTGLRAGDRVRVWPFDGELEVVAVVGPGRVELVGGAVLEPERVRLAAFSCAVCGACAGPEVAFPTVRPCPDCLIDLRRLERSPADAPRIRRAIESRAQAGLVEAALVGDTRLEERAADRRRWARRLREAGEDDLRAALLGAFGRAYERWSEDLGVRSGARP